MNALHAADWKSRTVGQFAKYALRQPGGAARLVGDLRAWSYHPHNRDGSLDDSNRRWVIEDGQGRILAEETSLYKAIHKIAE